MVAGCQRSGVAGVALALLMVLLCGSSGARAADPCTSGSFTVDLFSTGGAACDSNPFAKCLSSFSLTAGPRGGGCGITLTPLAASGVTIPELWTPAGSGSYAKYVTCPTSALTASVISSASISEILTAARGVLNSALWSTTVTEVAASPVVSAGVFSFTAATCALQYRITSSAGIAGAETAACAGVAGCQTDAPCAAGQYAVPVSGLSKTCALCPPGNYSAAGATACSPCGSGQAASAVGSASCSACAAGTYASGDGNSDCEPCDVGTYQSSTGSATCLTCPDDSYAQLPGATTCVRCAAGRPSACTQASCSSAASSAGYQSAAISSLSSLSSGTCIAAGWGTGVNAWAPRPSMMESCTMSTATRLSFLVRADCSVDIYALGDAACSDPTDPARPVLSGFYTSPTTISGMVEGTSSAVLKISNIDATTATMALYTATTDPTHQSAAGATCSGTLTVTGGLVAGAASATCPPGTLKSGSGASLSCRPCPVGMYCGATDADVATACTAGTQNPLRGAATNICANCTAGSYSGAAAATCSLCPVGTYTSATAATSCSPCYSDEAEVPGAASCTNAGVCGAGRAFNEISAQCEACDPGYVSDGTGPCTACPAGKEQNSDQSACTTCASGYFAPEAGTAACSACPAGSKRNATADLDATTCVSCGVGYVSNAARASTYCTACLGNTYRAGAASPSSNRCAVCPAGFATDAASASTTCTKCLKGTFRASGGLPSNVCNACPSGTVAPRNASASCMPCRAGSAPNAGATACVTCTTATYRPFFSSSNTCLTCGAGKETKSASGATACSSCTPGFYNGAGIPGSSVDSSGLLTSWQPACSACPATWYQSESGASTCTKCPAGSTSEDVGSDSCTACVPGTYAATEGSPCAECPAGSYVDASGATACKRCAIGTFTSDTGNDACSVCPAGRYANLPGSRSCKTCPAGTASSDGAGSCKVCPAGFFAPAGSSACSPCAKGTYNPTAGAGFCLACPIGSYCDVATLKAPKPCAAGSFSSSTGAATCAACSPNTYASSAGQAICKPCAKGTTTNKRSGQTTCITITPRQRLF